MQVRYSRAGTPALAAILVSALLTADCSFVATPTEERVTPALPFTVDVALFDQKKPDTLGLETAPGAETFTVYEATNENYQYNHGAVLIEFQGQFYMQWQSSAQDEDAPETQVRYAISDNAETWSDAITLIPPRTDAVVTNGGWWTDGTTLVAYINVWPTNLEPRGGYVEYISSEDGRHWSEPERVTTAEERALSGVIEQDMRQLDGKRLLTAVHEQPGLIAKPYFTDDPLGISGWTRGNMANLDHKPDITRELEPSWFVRKDGAVVMTFRDQESSFRILAALSQDRGETWSRPQVTEFYDSRAKQSAGNLPDGGAFIVNNPSGSKRRIPLAITTSASGEHFDRAYLVRAGGGDLQTLEYEGRYKREGYSYPKTYVGEDYIYVTYATNKEDIELTRIPVHSLRSSAINRLNSSDGSASLP